MPFSLSSYLLGVGTVVGALAFGFGGGVLLTKTAMKETATGPTRESGLPVQNERLRMRRN